MLRKNFAFLTLAVAALLFLALPSPSAAQTTNITGILKDRQCSVEDVFQLQPPTEKRCTLWIETSFPCASRITGVCKETHTVYCPNKAADNRPFNSAYATCSSPTSMQIGRQHTVSAFLRTPAQRADGYGDYQGFAFTY